MQCDTCYHIKTSHMIVIPCSEHLGKDIAISSLHILTETSSNLKELQKCKSVPE